MRMRRRSARFKMLSITSISTPKWPSNAASSRRGCASTPGGGRDAPPSRQVNQSPGWADSRPYTQAQGERMAAVDEKVKQIIVEQLGVDEGEVTQNASFVDDLGADSLDTVELVMAFEEAFEIEIPDEDAEKIRTVQDAVDYIGKHAKGGK